MTLRCYSVFFLLPVLLTSCLDVGERKQLRAARESFPQHQVGVDKNIISFNSPQGLPMLFHLNSKDSIPLNFGGIKEVTETEIPIEYYWYLVVSESTPHSGIVILWYIPTGCESRVSFHYNAEEIPHTDEEMSAVKKEMKDILIKYDRVLHSL